MAQRYHQAPASLKCIGDTGSVSLPVCSARVRAARALQATLLICLCRVPGPLNTVLLVVVS